MSEPKFVPPVADHSPVGPLTCDTPSPEAGVCMSPPAFDLSAGPDSTTPSLSCEAPVNSMEAPSCEVGVEDPILSAIHTAYTSSNHGWAKKQLDYLETVLPAIRNVAQGVGKAEPVPGSKHHPDTYAGYGLSRAESKGLSYLHKAIWDTSSPKKQLANFKRAKSAFKKALNLVRAFGKGKKWASNPGFKALMDAVEASINAPMASIESNIRAQLPKRVRRSGGGKRGTSGGGGKGFNRTKVEDLNSLPGLAKATAPEPGEGTLAHTVEANMNRDVKVVSGSVDDFLYTNIPDLVSGKGKSKKAMAAWRLIKAYRNKHLNPIFERYSKDPENAELKAEMDAAIAKMESEIGTEVRGLITDMWAGGGNLEQDFATESDSITKDVDLQATSLNKVTEDVDFDIKTIDKGSYAEAFKGLKNRVYKMRASAKKNGLSKTAKAGFNNPSYKAMQALGSVAGQFKVKHFRQRHLEKAQLKMEEAKTHLATLETNMKAEVEASKAKREQLKTIIDKINDPEQIPLVKPVKRHRVSVEYTNPDEEGDVVRANYKNKHESKIGVYENVWSPIGISDKKGSFSRPKGPKRGANIYNELKDNHGFTDSESKILGSISTGEGDYHSLNSVDMMRISLGMIQFAGTTFIKLLHDIQKTNSTYYKKQFGQYGLLITKGMPKSEIPTTVDRKDRHVPGAEHGKPLDQSKKAYKQWHNMLVVYDHRTREWVKGLEAMDVLQSDPRYLALIQESGRDETMQLMQIKTAGSSFLRALRTAKITYKDIGIKDQPKGEGIEIKDIFNSESAMYGISATAVAAGTGKGKGLAKKVLKAIVKGEGITTPEQLKALSQETITAYFKKIYSKWGRPTKLGEEIGSPLSDTTYSGKP